MAKSSSNLVNPNARDAMDRFKMEAASQVGVNLKQGYNGDLTSKQAGSVGGQMVNVICPVRQTEYSRSKWDNREQIERVTYVYGIAL